MFVYLLFSNNPIAMRPHYVNPVRKKSIPWKRLRLKEDRSTEHASGALNASASYGECNFYYYLLNVS